MRLLIIGCLWSLLNVTVSAADRPPNFVIIFADDLGYGDLSCYGHPTIRTPHLDRMAAEGMRFTQFYVGEPVCTPSRAALLTGRLPVRSGMYGDDRRVLMADSEGGLPAEEITIAEILKDAGYRCGCVGKWHLGHLPAYLPDQQGFHSFFGLPYSNDMNPVKDENGKTVSWNAALMRDTEVIERPADQTTLTKRYTEKAVEFIHTNKDQPFFLYFPHTFPHVPLFRSAEFADTSRRGLYGDVVEELDWSVGQVLDALRSEGLAENTFVFFTSDNGPWLVRHNDGGSAGLLKDGKGSTWEGGMREPAIAWWPGHIPAGKVTAELATTMDLLPTLTALAKAKLPDDRVLDGVDLSSLLLEGKSSLRDTVYFYRGSELMAVRHGPWKAHFVTRDAYGPGARKPIRHDPPLLYQLDVDPSERFDVHKAHPDVLKKMDMVVKDHRSKLIVRPSEFKHPEPTSR